MSLNKSLTFINHNHNRRTSRKTHCWIKKLNEYDYLSYTINANPYCLIQKKYNTLSMNVPAQLNLLSHG